MKVWCSIVMAFLLLPQWAAGVTVTKSDSCSLKVGVIVAMEKELNMLQNHFDDNDGVVVRQCGIGKVNAALGCAEMISTEHPDIIISMGCAGGCGEELHVGDVVVATETAYHDVYCGTAIDDSTVYGQVQGLPARYKADPHLLQVALGLKSQSSARRLKSQVHQGLIVTGDWFVDTKEKMRSIVSIFPDAIAVDMESAAIAQTCHIYGVPFISVRVVSDMPLTDEHASQYHNFWASASDITFTISRAFIEQLCNNQQ